jgi:hypothetical protein
MQCSIIATARDAFSCVETTTLKRVSAVAKRKASPSEAEDYRQSVLGQLWEDIVESLEWGDEEDTVFELVLLRCNRLKGCWRSQWPKGDSENELPELLDYRPEWLTPTELIAIEAHIAEAELRAEAELAGKKPADRKRWFSQRGLADLLGCDRSQVLKIQAEALLSVIERCERVKAEAELYRNICAALSELLD